MSGSVSDYLTTASSNINVTGVASGTSGSRLVITSPRGLYLTSSILWGNSSTPLTFNSTAGFFFNKSDGSTPLCAISSSGIFACKGLVLQGSVNITCSKILCTTSFTTRNITSSASSISCAAITIGFGSLTLNVNTFSTDQLTLNGSSYTFPNQLQTKTLNVSGNVNLNTSNTYTTIGPQTGCNNTPGCRLVVCDGANDNGKYAACQIVRKQNDFSCYHLSLIRSINKVWSFGIDSDSKFGLYQDGTINLANKASCCLQFEAGAAVNFFNGALSIKKLNTDSVIYDATKGGQHQFYVGNGYTDPVMQIWDGGIWFGMTTTTIRASRIGIGMNSTTTPNYPLEITSTYYDATVQANFNFNFDNSRYSFINNNRARNNVSIYTDGTVMANLLFFYSDRRIKTNIIDIDDISALDTLRLIKPRRFNYIDSLTKSPDPVWGFIAQEVAEVLPYSTYTSIDKIPNVFDLAMVASDNVTITLFSKSTSLFERDSSGNLLKISLYDNKRQTINTTITSIIDDKTFVIADVLTAEQTTMTGFGNESRIFVYGSIVDDFHNLNRDAIFTIATAALQELDREYQATKLDVVNLNVVVNDLQNINDDLEKQYDELCVAFETILLRV